MDRKDDPRSRKISSEFATRLGHLRPEQVVRASVLVSTGDIGKLAGQRQSTTDRQAAIEVTRKSAERALDDIDRILERFGGHQLSAGPNAVGSIHIEATAAGINALAALKCVKAIIEDQEISGIL